jgi:hypothetical protein
MYFYRILIVLIILTLSLSTCNETKGEALSMELKRSSRFLNLEESYYDKGMLLVLWSEGENYPLTVGTLSIMSKVGANEISLTGVSDVRWSATGDVIASQSLKGGTSRIIRLNLEGKVLTSYGDNFMMGYPVPHQTEDKLALIEYDTKGISTLEIRTLNSEFNKVAELKAAPRQRLSSPIWSGDGSRVAVAVRMADSKGRLWPLLTVLDKNLQNIKYPMGHTVEMQSEPAGITPLFWFEDFVFGRSDRGLLKCNLGNGDSKLIYSPGKDRSIIGGALVVNRKALILVRDLRLDPLEVRAKEIYEVNLDDGSNRLVVRAPDNMFILSLDWRENSKGLK